MQVLDKLMATRPVDRYQTGSEAAEALQSLIRSRKPAPASRQPEAPRPPIDLPVTPARIPPVEPTVPVSGIIGRLHYLIKFIERRPQTALAVTIIGLSVWFLTGFALGWLLKG